MSKNKLFLLPLLAVAVFSLFFVVDLHAASSSDLTILHFNDYHAHVLPYKLKWRDKVKAAGIARLAAQIRMRKNRKTLVLCGGDVLQGSPFSTMFRGKVSISLFNGIIDYMVIGNHEFDYGQANLKSLIRGARFKIFASNVKKRNGALFAGRNFYVKWVNGVKVGIFGLTASETAITTHPKNAKGLRFLNEIAVAKQMVAQLKRQGARVIIALTHMGVELDKKMAKEVSGIDLIVGGHSHTVLPKGIQIGKTLIVQAGQNGLYLGKVEIKFDRRRGKIRSASAKLIKMVATMREDAIRKRKIAKFKNSLDGALQKVIGRTTVYLDGKRKNVRSKESNMANFITDVVRDATGADIAVINGGGVRAPIEKGKIRVLDVLKVLPFNNGVTVMQLPGKTIIAMLKRSASRRKGAGSFLQVSGGLIYTIRKGKLGSVLFKGRPLNPNKMYTVATSDFLAAGGDGYHWFKTGRNIRATGNTMSDTVIRAIKKLKVISPRVEGRIRRL